MVPKTSLSELTGLPDIVPARLIAGEFKPLLHDYGIHAASVRQDNIRSCTIDKPKHVTERIGSQTERESVRIWPGVASSNKESTMSEDIELVSLEELDRIERDILEFWADDPAEQELRVCRAARAAIKLKQRVLELEEILKLQDEMAKYG